MTSDIYTNNGLQYIGMNNSSQREDIYDQLLETAHQSIKTGNKENISSAVVRAVRGHRINIVLAVLYKLHSEHQFELIYEIIQTIFTQFHSNESQKKIHLSEQTRQSLGILMSSVIIFKDSPSKNQQHTPSNNTPVLDKLFQSPLEKAYQNGDIETIFREIFSSLESQKALSDEAYKYLILTIQTLRKNHQFESLIRILDKIIDAENYGLLEIVSQKATAGLDAPIYKHKPSARDFLNKVNTLLQNHQADMLQLEIYEDSHDHQHSSSLSFRNRIEFEINLLQKCQGDYHHYPNLRPYCLEKQQYIYNRVAHLYEHYERPVPKSIGIAQTMVGIRQFIHKNCDSYLYENYFQSMISHISMYLSNRQTSKALTRLYTLQKYFHNTSHFPENIRLQCRLQSVIDTIKGEEQTEQAQDAASHFNRFAVVA